MTSEYVCTYNNCKSAFETKRGRSLHEGQKHKDPVWRSKEKLEQLYLQEKKNIYEIGEELDANPVTIHKWLNRHDIPRRTRSESQRLRHGTKAPVSIKIHRDGYLTSYFNHKNEYFEVRIHRLAAVAWFGFDEVRDKVIHHKNTHRMDNRESNLEPMTLGEHSAHHIKEQTRAETGELKNDLQ